MVKHESKPRSLSYLLNHGMEREKATVLPPTIKHIFLNFHVINFVHNQ